MKRPPKVTLTVRRVGPHQYRVGQHDVDLHASDAAGRCTCGDYLYRKEAKGLACKHLRAAALLEGTPTTTLTVTLP